MIALALLLRRGFGWLILHPLVIVIIVLVLWGAKGRLQAAAAVHAREQAVTTLHAEQSAHSLALAKAEQDAVAERSRILTAQQEALNDANQRTKRAQQQRTQASAALADSQRLLHDAIARVGGGAASGDPAAGGNGAAAGRLGPLLEACASEHRRLALDADRALDEARNAGLACEQSYDALTRAPTTP